MGNYGKVFAGNANAETGSLQIISTIQDTDNNTQDGDGAAMVQSKSTVIADGNLTGTDSNTSSNDNQSETDTQVSASIGTDYVR